MVNLDSTKRKIEKLLNKFFIEEGYEKSEIDNLYRITEFENSAENYIDLYIYAELDVDDFFKILDKLNEIVMLKDDSAYFDIISPGIYMARIYDVKMNSSNYNITQSDLTRFSQAAVENVEDELNETFWVDDIKYDKQNQDISIKISSDSYDGMAFIRIDISSITSYSDLVDIYLDETVDKLLNDIYYDG